MALIPKRLYGLTIHISEIIGLLTWQKKAKSILEDLPEKNGEKIKSHWLDLGLIKAKSSLRTLGTALLKKCQFLQEDREVTKKFFMKWLNPWEVKPSL